MINANNEYYQNGSINIRKDNDEWKNASDTCGVVSEDTPAPAPISYNKKDVNFYDYDGTVVASYTTNEFVNITDMPENPMHEGLTAQGWNWSLSDAKSYVASYGKLEIGQMYVTDDGKTRLYITLTDGRTSPILHLYLYDNSELDIDWGDDSIHSTFTSTDAGYISEKHEYLSAGDYVIAIAVTAGGFDLQSSVGGTVSTILWNGSSSTSSPDRTYNNSIKKVEIGTGVTTIGASAFLGCFSLAAIVIPNSVTNIGSSVFMECYSLKSITIPEAVTIIGGNAFYYCSSLAIVALPNSIVSFGTSVFYSCVCLTAITIPNSLTSIGQNAFQYCRSLVTIVIPNSVTDINKDAFDSCYSLTTISIPNSVISIDRKAFDKCYSLAKITIDKTKGAIAYSPWGAITGSPTYTQIVWNG